MYLKGFIKELGETRSWTNKEGATMMSVKLTLQVPYVARDGQERFDELMGEICYGNQQFLEGLRQAQQAHEKCEMQVGFSLSDWQGRQIQNIKVYSVRKMI